MSHFNEQSPSLIAQFISKRTAIWVTYTILAILGLYTLLTAQREGQPSIEFGVAVARVSLSGVSPKDMDRIVGVPLQNEIRGLDNVDYTRIVSKRGSTIAVTHYKQGTDMNYALNDFRTAVDNVEQTLPSDASVDVGKVGTDDTPLITVTISSDDTQVLNRVAKDIQRRGKADKGVSDVNLFGTRDRAVVIYFDPQKLQHYGFTLGEIQNAITSGDVLLSAGTLDTGSGRIQATVSGSLKNAQEIGNVVLRASKDGTSIHLSDIATVKMDYLSRTSGSRYNGKNSLTVEFNRQSGENLIDTSNRLKLILEEAKEKDGIQYKIISNAADFTQEIFSGLVNTVTFASLLVAVFMLMVLGFRSGILVAAIIPLTVLISIALVVFFGVTLNMMVLFGFMMTSGMVVDAGIVLVEYADQKINSGMSPLEAYTAAIKVMFFPIFTGMLTTIAVYLPLLFWPGIAGQFMRYLIITIPLALIVSLFAVFSLVPSVGSAFPAPMREAVEDSKQTLPQRIYGRILELSLEHRWKTILLVLLLTIATIVTYVTFSRGVTFIVDTDPDTVNIKIYSPNFYSLKQSEKIVSQIEKEVLKYPEFAHVSSRFYVPKGGFGDRSDRVGVIQLIYAKGSKTPIEEIKARIEKTFNSQNYPGLDFGLSLVNSSQTVGPPKKADISIRLAGENSNKIQVVSARLARMLKNNENFVHVSDSSQGSRFELNFEVNRMNLSYYGVSLYEISHQIQLFTDSGFTVRKDYTPEGEIEPLDIVAFYPRNESQNWSRLLTTTVPTSKGRVPLGEFVKIRYQKSEKGVRRRDDDVVVNVNTDVSEASGLSASQGQSLVKKILSQHPEILGDSVRWQFGGDQKNQNEAQSFLIMAFGIGVGLIVIILLFQFNNFYFVFIIALAIVFSTFGAFLGVLISKDRVLSIVMFGLAVLSLAGVVVNNNIVLISSFQSFLKEGYEPREAAYHAALSRFRAVNLTAWTTVAGLIPSALLLSVDFIHFTADYNSTSSQMFSQLVRANITGFAFASVITLFLTPSLLSFSKTNTQPKDSWFQKIRMLISKKFNLPFRD